MSIKELYKSEGTITKEYSIHGIPVVFSTYSAFDHRCFLRWIASALEGVSSKDRMTTELALRNLALCVVSFGEESIGRLSEGQTLYSIYKEDYMSDIDSFDKVAFDIFDNKFSAIGTLPEAATLKMMDSLKDFTEKYNIINYSSGTNDDIYDKIDIGKLLFDPYLKITLTLEDDITVTFAGIDNRTRLIIDRWVDGDVNDVLSMPEYTFIRAMKYLSATVVDINGNLIGNRELASNKIKDMTDEEIMDLFESRYALLSNMPFGLLQYIDSVRTHLSMVMDNKLDDEGDIQDF